MKDRKFAGNALDLGAGLGNGIRLLPAFEGKWIGVEKSGGMVKRNHEKYDILIHSDACNVPLKNSSCNIILCIGLSEYVSDSVVLLKEIYRLLDKDGLAVYTSSPKTGLNFVRRLWNDRIFLRNENQVRDTIISAGFEIVKTSKTLMQNQYLLRKIF